MHEVTRRFEVDAAHRLLKHAGKCAHIHGHRYAFEVTFALSAGGSGYGGIIVDFGDLKARLGDALDRLIDHGILLEESDPLIKAVRQADPEAKILELDFAPTAENLACYVWELAGETVCRGALKCTRVRCYETPNCWADYTPTRL